MTEPGEKESPSPSAPPPGKTRARWNRLKSRIAARLSWAWRPLLYAGLILGLLTGRAVEVSQVAPFGIAFYAAVRGAGLPAVKALPVALAVAVGALTTLPLLQAGWVALAILSAHLVAGLFRIRPERPKPLAAALVAAAATALPLLMQRPDLLQVAFWSGMAGLLAVVFTVGVADVTSGRFLRAGSSDLPVPAIILVAAALTGLQGVVLWDTISLHGVTAGLAVMASAYAGGLPLGASAGAVIGISFFISALGMPIPTGPGAGLPSPEAQTLSYVIAGFLAGAFRDLGKSGVSLSYALAFITYTMATQGQGSVLEAMALTALAAVALFWATPRGWILHLPADLVLTPPVQAGEQREAPGPAPEAAEQLRSMARVLKEVQRTLEQTAAAEAPAEPGASQMLEQVTDRVCRSCSMYAQCWRRDLDKSFHLFSALWAELEREGPLAVAPLPPELERHCIYPDQIVSTLNYLHEIDRSRRAFSRQLEEGRSIAGDYVQNVSRLLDQMAEEVAQSDGRPGPTNVPVMKVTAGVARLPKRGGHVSGDSFEATPLSGGRYLMALSDGMGVGQQAAAQSKQCVRLLRQLLDAGFTTDVAVKTVNSVLLLRAPEESFATVDLTLIDLGTGRAEFVKVGAAPSFVQRGSDVTVIKLPSVPVGIINQVEVEPEFRTLRPGDRIVMVSDGVWDVSKQERDKEGWIFDYLAREQSQDAEEVAEGLLARTLDQVDHPEDDLTVLVGQVCGMEGGRSEVKPTPVRSGEWVPAQQAPRARATGSVPGREPHR